MDRYPRALGSALVMQELIIRFQDEKNFDLKLHQC